jgi:DsbC/DsbD-like thiol-disulfide interchange protein
MSWNRNPARRLMLVVVLALSPVLTAGVARSQSLVSTGESVVHVSLLPGRAEPDGSRMAGLLVEVAPEWKTYWRHPGAAGVPPQFDWSGSRNLASAKVQWPRPSVFESFGMTTFGYSGKVVLPVRLVPERADQPIDVDLSAELGVCHDICLLEQTEVQARIAPDAPEQGAELIAAAEAAVPRPGAEQGLVGATCRISGTGTERRFDAVLDFARPLQDPMVVLEGPPTLGWFSGVETKPVPGAKPESSRLEVAAALSLLDESTWIDRSDVRITILAGGFAADVRGCTAPAG